MDLDMAIYFSAYTLNSDTNYANTNIHHIKNKGMINYRAFKFCIRAILKIIWFGT